jgi:Tfp pilus assembly protein PilV
MGWMIAFIFLVIAALLAFLLLHTLQERRSLVARIAALEPAADECGELRSERDKLAAESDHFRSQVIELSVAHEEKARLLAKCDAARSALQIDRDRLQAAHNAITTRMEGVLDADAERAKVLADAKRIAEEFNAEVRSKTAKYESVRESREAELADLESRLVPLRQEHRLLSEEASLREMGFYKSHYGFATSERYKKAIDENYAKQKAMLIEL